MHLARSIDGCRHDDAPASVSLRRHRLCKTVIGEKVRGEIARHERGMIEHSTQDPFGFADHNIRYLRDLFARWSAG